MCELLQIGDDLGRAGHRRDLRCGDARGGPLWRTGPEYGLDGLARTERDVAFASSNTERSRLARTRPRSSNWSAPCGTSTIGSPHASVASVVPEPAWQTTASHRGRSGASGSHCSTWTFSG